MYVTYISQSQFRLRTDELRPITAKMDLSAVFRWRERKMMAGIKVRAVIVILLHAFAWGMSWVDRESMDSVTARDESI